MCLFATTLEHEQRTQENGERRYDLKRLKRLRPGARNHVSQVERGGLGPEECYPPQPPRWSKGASTAGVRRSISKINRKALTRGRTDHFSTKNSTWKIHAAVTYMQFQIQVSPIVTCVTRSRKCFLPVNFSQRWPLTLSLSTMVKVKMNQGSFRSKVIVQTNRPTLPADRSTRPLNH